MAANIDFLTFNLIMYMSWIPSTVQPDVAASKSNLIVDQAVFSSKHFSQKAIFNYRLDALNCFGYKSF